jgi:cysteinyl-tRNA synthetase
MLNKLDQIVLKKKNIDLNKIDELVLARTSARAQKDFSEADRIRIELDSLGVELYDDEGKSRWRVKK